MQRQSTRSILEVRVAANVIRSKCCKRRITVSLPGVFSVGTKGVTRAVGVIKDADSAAAAAKLLCTSRSQGSASVPGALTCKVTI